MQLTKRPGFIVGVYDDHGGQREHHAHVREGQVDDEKVGGRSQGFGEGEDVDDKKVTSDGGDAEAEHDESDNAVPQGVHRSELVPVIKKRVKIT